MVARQFLFSLISLHLMMVCTGSNGMCKTSIGHGWACFPPWYQWGGKCYRAIMETLTWFEAKEECIKMGGILVVPQSQEETEFLMQLLPFSFWINCNDLEAEGTWICQDGTGVVQYRNWLKTGRYGEQPDNNKGNEHCAEVYNLPSGEWNDLKCSKRYPAICKAAASKRHRCNAYN